MKPILIVQNCKDELSGTILEYLKDKELPYSIVQTYTDEPLPDPESIGPVISLGCPLSVITYHEHEFLKQLYAYTAELVRRNHPCLGICFSGQMLAKVLGAKVKNNEIKEVGCYTVRLTAEGEADPIFNRFDKEFPVLHWHGDTFSIPFGTTRLVEGDDCRNQAFRKGSLVAVQFHLEATAAEVEAWCDVYPRDLADVGKTKQNVVEQYRSIAEQVRLQNDLLLDNFLSL